MSYEPFVEQAYLNEYAYRFNRRLNRGMSFDSCLRMLLATSESLKYDDLYHVAEPPHPPHPNPALGKTAPRPGE